MSLRLILMRHAKSDWNLPVSDHNRDLNERGRTSAKAMGKWLKELDFIPEQALVSTSKRTRKTFEYLSIKPKRLEFIKKLYHPSVYALLNTLKGANGQTVLIISHNPAIAEFAENLAIKSPNHKLFYKYPTCATWVAELEIKSWEEVQFGTARTLEFGIPREVIKVRGYSY
ncbi:MAG: phosphoglycerate mutase [Rhodobacteraceae bacterium]|nr:phosphoglycerate mutase [Paracoccaceae bacterium]